MEESSESLFSSSSDIPFGEESEIPCKRLGSFYASKGSSRWIPFLLFSGIGLCFFVTIASVGILLSFSLLNSQSNGENIDSIIVPEGMRLVRYNHFTFRQHTTQVKSASSSYMIINEDTDPEEFNILDINDEVYFVSEVEPLIDCIVYCDCGEGTYLEMSRRGREFNIMVRFAALGVSLWIYSILHAKFNSGCQIECEKDAVITFHFRNSSKEAEIEDNATGDYVADFECTPSDLPGIFQQQRIEILTPNEEVGEVEEVEEPY